MANFREAAGDVVAPPRRLVRAGFQTFHQALDLWDRLAPGLSVEEYYVMMDLLERLGTQRGYDYKARNAEYLIAKTLQHRGSRLNLAYLEVFAQSLTRPLAPGVENVVFSLNWDNLFERAFEAIHGHRPDDGLGILPIEDAVPSVRFPLPLFKLHGCLDWILCKGCDGGQIYQAPSVDSTLRYWEQEGAPLVCPRNAHHKLVPFFIPPSAQKIDYRGDPGASIKKHDRIDPEALRGYWIGKIWSAARMQLRGLDRLVIVGYSFPPTDARFRMLLLEILSSRDRDRRLHVDIVTKAAKPSEQRNLIAGYRRNLGLGPGGKFHRFLHRPRFTFDGFRQWIEDQKHKSPYACLEQTR